MASDSSKAPPTEAPDDGASSPPATATKKQLHNINHFPQNDPKVTGFDPETKWWINLFHILTGNVTPEGQFWYREWRFRANEERDCKRCEKNRDYMLKHSPTIVFMREKIEALNGRVDGDNIRCRRCPAWLTEDGGIHGQSGGFSPDHGILLCANHLRDRSKLEDTLAHEMIHAWDHLRWKVDYDGNLKHAACTEIRASMLSGECRWAQETFSRGNRGLSQQFQNCVRRRAIQSVTARRHCKDDVQATKIVNQVWDSCFSDTRPFDEVYR